MHSRCTSRVGRAKGANARHLQHQLLHLIYSNGADRANNSRSTVPSLPPVSLLSLSFLLLLWNGGLLQRLLVANGERFERASQLFKYI